MGLSQDFNSTARRRRRRLQRRLRGYLVFGGVAACILLLSWAITAVIEGGSKAAPEQTPTIQTGTAGSILAPLPMQGGEAVTLESFGPTLQSTGAYSIVKRDSSVIRQPVCGQVELSYFSDAVFLGDSLTEGFTEYNINVSGALICGYVGVSPSAIVNRSTVNHPQRGSEVALDVIAAAAPKKLYVLLGTNSLTTLGNDESFLAYYDAMLDALRGAVGSECVIYVQSIPPVQASALETRPGLASDRIKTINESLAALAEAKGCCYIDLWEALADENGALTAKLAAADGVHLTAGNGYTAWVNYLRTHTKYDAASPWTPGSAYAS